MYFLERGKSIQIFCNTHPLFGMARTHTEPVLGRVCLFQPLVMREWKSILQSNSAVLQLGCLKGPAAAALNREEVCGSPQRCIWKQSIHKACRLSYVLWVWCCALWAFSTQCSKCALQQGTWRLTCCPLCFLKALHCQKF